MTETVLTDKQIERVVCDAGHAYVYWLENRPAADGRCVHEIARAIESAVLQSPKVVVLRKDAERLDWLEKHFIDVLGIYKDAHGEILSLSIDCEDDSLADGDQGRIRSAVDAAMEAKP